MKTKTLRNILLAVATGLAIGVAYADSPGPYNEGDPTPTCPIDGGTPPTVVVGYGCSNSCSPFATGCCAYKTYWDNGVLKTWRECSMLLFCSNPLNVPNGKHCNPIPPTEVPPGE